MLSVCTYPVVDALRLGNFPFHLLTNSCGVIGMVCFPFA